jgi:hypothetical protein
MPTMIFAELKPQIEQLPREEMLKALAYLKHLVRAENTQHREDLAQRHADIDAGRKVSLSEAKRRLGES